MDILKYRKSEDKANEWPKLHYLHTAMWVPYFLMTVGTLGICLNLGCIHKYIADPKLATEFQNGMYFAFSRCTFVLAFVALGLCIFIGKLGKVKAHLSGTNMLVC